MKKILGIIIAIVIIIIFLVIHTIYKAIVAIEKTNNPDMNQITYLLLGLSEILPFIVAFFLIKFSWKRITANKEKENENL